MPTQSTDTNSRQEEVCPFLGFKDDPDTALSYPSQYNCCFHAKPVIAPGFPQQSKFCLGNEYAKCPIYKVETITSLPKEFRYQNPGEKKIKPWVSLIIVIILIVVGGILSTLLGIIHIPGIPPIFSMNQNTQTSTVEVLPPKSTITILPTFTPTKLGLSTATVTPAVTAVSKPHFLETPFGNDPQLMIHRIREGEGFIMLAANYKTSVDAIKTINYALSDTLIANKIIVIPFNTTNLNSFPPFSTYEVQVEEIIIEDLASLLKVEAGSLRKFNDLPEGYTLSKGEWLLIPH